MNHLAVHFGAQIERVPLDQSPVVIGRGTECNVRIPDRCLSRQHCRIFHTDGHWLVEDLGSLRGTKLDGVAVRQPLPLRPGSRVHVGESFLVFEPTPEATIQERSSLDRTRVRLLLETVGDLYGTAGLEELLRTIVDRAILVAGGDRGALLLIGARLLEVAVARNSAGLDLPTDEYLTRALPARALQTGCAVVLTDTQVEQQKAQATPSVLDGGIRSVLCVPLPGTPTGVLYVDGSRPVEDFGPTDLAIFEALAAQAALAIERTRMREQMARRDRDDKLRLERENADLRAGSGPVAPIGHSAAIQRALESVRRVAHSDATVCLTGETGTGKEVLARHLHRIGPRADGPFIVVDCGSIPEGLIESELFGHERGAFTNAASARLGRFREASGGTLFLDEIGELPLALQTRLLRVLQERTVHPVGAAGPVPVDVRVVCATHRDLRRKVEEGTFRQDLFYRIAVVTIPIPALRERSDDIASLARHFLQRASAARPDSLTCFTHDAVEAMLAHGWPGNVRELEHRIQRATLFAVPPCVTAGDLGLVGESAGGTEVPADPQASLPPLPAARARASERFERAYLEEAFQRSKGRMARAAKLAGVTRQMIRKLVLKHGIDPRRFAR